MILASSLYHLPTARGDGWPTRVCLCVITAEKQHRLQLEGKGNAIGWNEEDGRRREGRRKRREGVKEREWMNTDGLALSDTEKYYIFSFYPYN
jgi:hypothetical protein